MEAGCLICWVLSVEDEVVNADISLSSYPDGDPEEGTSERAQRAEYACNQSARRKSGGARQEQKAREGNPGEALPRLSLIACRHDDVHIP